MTWSVPDCVEYAVETTEFLYRHYGIHDHFPTRVVSNRSGSVHKGDGQMYPHQIIYSRSMIQNNAIRGFQEYKSLRWMWMDIPKGLEAIHRLVLHEFAHVLQTEEQGKRERGVVHKHVFIRCLQRLQKEFPYEEID